MLKLWKSGGRWRWQAGGSRAGAGGSSPRLVEVLQVIGQLGLL